MGFGGGGGEGGVWKSVTLGIVALLQGTVLVTQQW